MLTGKKLPKEGILKEYALRRMNEAQLKEINGHLSKLRKTDDLSYTNLKNGQSDTGEEGQQQLIPEETLLQLLDEAREEEDRLAIMSNLGDQDNEDKLQVEIYKYQQSAQNEIKKFEETGQKLKEAEQAVAEAFQMRSEIQDLLKHDDEEDKKTQGAIQSLENIERSGVFQKMEDLRQEALGFTQQKKEEIK